MICVLNSDFLQKASHWDLFLAKFYESGQKPCELFVWNHQYSEKFALKNLGGGPREFYLGFMYTAQSSDHSLLTLSQHFKVNLRRFEVDIWCLEWECCTFQKIGVKNSFQKIYIPKSRACQSDSVVVVVVVVVLQYALTFDPMFWPFQVLIWNFIRTIEERVWYILWL